MIYLTIGLYLGAIALYFDQRFFRLGLVLLFLFSGLDYLNGYDWINYYHHYDAATANELFSTASFIYEGSVGFSLIMGVAKLLGNYQYVFIISSLIFVFCLNRFCRMFQNRNLALFMCFSFYGYFYFVERIKQGLAIALVLMGYELLRRGRRLRFIACVVCAAAFHPSALMAIFLWALPLEGRRRKGEIFFGTLFCVIGFFLISTVVLVPSLSNSIPVVSLYVSKYSDLIKENYNILFFISVGGVSFVAVLVIMLRVATKAGALRLHQYAFLVYFFSYITNVFYGMIRVMNYFYVVVIDALVTFSERRSRFSLLRCSVFLIALIQLVRPMANKLYLDSIMDYQLWGVSSRTPAQMEHLRCRALFADSVETDWADQTCQ